MYKDCKLVFNCCVLASILSNVFKNCNVAVSSLFAASSLNSAKRSPLDTKAKNRDCWRLPAIIVAIYLCVLVSIVSHLPANSVITSSKSRNCPAAS